MKDIKRHDVVGFREGFVYKGLSDIPDIINMLIKRKVLMIVEAVTENGVKLIGLPDALFDQEDLIIVREVE